MNELGGKAQGLNILTELGYNVPEYFVVPFSQNLDDQDLIQQISGFGLKFDRVAVRSSANIEDGEKASFAGQFTSFLNVPTDKIIESIEKVRNSVKSPNVKSYCEVMGIPVDDIKMNVIVQKFDEPQSAGVWMGNSVLGGRLEWAEGRGDQVVNGEVIPFYESYGEGGKLIEKSSKGILTDETGKSVADICKEIQSKLGYDADLEFCITDEGIQWLQLRRVTSKLNLQ